MRLIELEVGSFFWTERWSENVVGEVVEEVSAVTGLVLIHVHCLHPDLRRPSTLRSRLTSDLEMVSDEWVKVEKPDWVLERTGGSDGS